MKHHYLSQFYLQGFSADGRGVFQVEKVTGRFYSVAIHDAAAIRDYHELDHEDFKDPNAFEKLLSVAEGHFSKILKDVLASGISSREQHARIIELVNLMRVRVPAQKAHIEQVLEGSVQSVAKLLERHGKLPPPSKPGGSVLDEVKLSIRNFKVVQMMFMLAGDPDILGILASMKPILIDAPESSSFVTCDNPVAIYHPTASENDLYGAALIDTRIELSFPLSRQVLLKLTWPTGQPERRSAAEGEVDELNRRSIIMADEYIFAHAPTESVTRAVAEFGKYHAGVEHDVVEQGDSFFHVSRSRAVLAPERYAK